MPPVRWIDLGETESWRTQAVYHALAQDLGAGGLDAIVVCRPAAPYLCLGFSQELEEVLDWDACRRLGLPVLRRWVGGGTTYLDSNQLFYQCIFHRDRTAASVGRQFEQFLAAPVAALRRLDIPARLSGTNEIVAAGRRLAGTGGGRIEQAVVVVGNLLFDFAYAKMAEAWLAPAPGFRELARRALQEHIGTLKDWGVQADFADVIPLLRQEFERALGRPTQDSPLSAAEEDRARQVAPELTIAGPSGRPPRRVRRPLKIAAGVFIHYETARVNGAELAASLCVKDGLIAAARVESGPPGDWPALERGLAGLTLAEWPAAARRQAAGESPASS